jgi:hypothetical protein
MTTDDPGWVKAAARSDLAEGEALGIVIAGREIALYDIDGTLYATDDICTHAYAKLSDGWLDRGEIECPLRMPAPCRPFRRQDRQGDRPTVHRRHQGLRGPG